MSSLQILLTLIRFCASYFALNTSFAILVYFVAPIPLGLATRAFFDAVAGQPAGLNVWSAIALLVGLQLAEALAGPALGAPWSPLQAKSHVLLRRNLFAGILRGYGRHGLPATTGEVINRFRDDPEIIADTLDSLCDLIGRTCFAIGAVYVMWQINPTITATLLLPLVLCSFVTELLGNQIKVYSLAARAAAGRVTGFLGELLGAQLALKAAGAAAHAVARLEDLGDARRKAAVRDRVFSELLNSLNVNLVHLGSGAVLLLGAQSIATGSFTVGDLALFVVYLDQLGWYPAEIGRLIGGLKRIDVSYGRLNAMTPGEPAAALVTPTTIDRRGAPPLPPPPPREPLNQFEARHLTYTRPGGAPGLVDVSFTLPRGSCTVVTGRIGSGKTTLLEVVLGLLPHDSGEIRWNGQVIADASAYLVPPRAAYTPQAPHLFSETLRENLLLGWPAETGALDRAVHAAALEADVATLERGLDTLIGPRGVKLSGGQVQRAAAARMFVRAPELLVFDDLSSALDAETEAALWSRLFDQDTHDGERAVTSLIVSHRAAALRRADQVLVMAAGRIVARGSLAELLMTSPTMQEIWRDLEQSPAPIKS